MSTKTKTLAKSLHTITVLVRVAEFARATIDPAMSCNEAVTIALRELGYEGAGDPYALARKALDQMLAARKH